MKCIRKTIVLIDNSGESIVEVLVAFTLLSIMLVAFAQGISWATTTEYRASKTRQTADDSMIKLQQALAGQSGVEGVNCVQDSEIELDSGAKIYHYTYIVDGYSYVVYSTVGSTPEIGG